MSRGDTEAIRVLTEDRRAASGIAEALDHLLDPLEGLLVVDSPRPVADPEQVEVPYDTSPNALRGENAEATIALRASDARKGGRAFVAYKVSEWCGDCRGSGRYDPGHLNGGDNSATMCTRCHGRGRTEVERQLSVLVPPGITDGAQLRVRGEGGRPDGEGVPGDLMLHVFVLPRPGFGTWLRRSI